MAALESWKYSPDRDFRAGKLHIDVIADYGGGHTPDPAFTEVQNHFLRHDPTGIVELVTPTPVHGFSTIETGFWIAQEALHSEHPNLVIFSNTAPRSTIAWTGQKEQPFVCGILDNGVPVFAVQAGYNLSFVKDRLQGLWEVNVPNIGTQFRSRDQYPKATMAILHGEVSLIGKPVDVSRILKVPVNHVASIDGYGNIKTTTRHDQVSSTWGTSPKVRITLNGQMQEAVNTLAGQTAKQGELKIGVGSSGGKDNPFIEIVRIMGSAQKDFNLRAPADDLQAFTITPV